MADTADVIWSDDSATVGTHALVIGVGEYPHLIGGAAPASATDGLRQLSSPPVSARAFARWLLSDYRCPGKDLASLSLLTSEPAPTPFTDPRTGDQRPVATAGVKEIVTAVRAWKERGDSSADNRLFFYFCGHGISEGDDMALLAREFSLDDPNPLEGALDFRRLVDGLRKCRASQQIYFVDACRASSDVLISQSGGAYAGQVPFLGGMRPLEWPRRDAITYYATLSGDLAYARPGTVSLFTEAMLRALRGAGSDDADGAWWVNTSRLHEAITHFMNQPVFAGTAAGVQVPAVSAMPVFPLHHVADGPLVPVYVGCVPSEANASAEFVCRQGGQERCHRTPAEIDPNDPTKVWLVDLPAGSYEFEARLAPNDCRVNSREVRPIFRSVDLKAAP